MRPKLDLYFFALSLLLVLFLNCPKRIGPTAKIIEVAYVGAIYDDLFKEKPALSAAADSNKITIGYLDFRWPFLDVVLERTDFFEALSRLPVDYIIMDRPVYGFKFFPIKRSMGYGITNYKGIRFAIVSKDKDSLSIRDETMLALVRERSDVAWIIDNAFLKLPPVLVDFKIEGRILSDTIMKPLKTGSDSSAGVMIRGIQKMLNETLNRVITTGPAGLKEYVLQGLSSHFGANVVLYPASAFRNVTVGSAYRLGDVLTMVACEMRFSASEMKKTNLVALVQRQQYSIWGVINKNNVVVCPADTGTMLFDVVFGEQKQE
jgi:hypothetical protein